VTQQVSCQAITMEGMVQSKASPCGICGGQIYFEAKAIMTNLEIRTVEHPYNL
jgi:hypothetical protein